MELKDLSLPGVGLALVGELLALYIKLSGLDLQQLSLLSRGLLLIGNLPLDGPDFLELFAECQDSECGRNDGKHGEDSGS